MPTIRKLQESEVQGLTNKGETARAQVAREYDGYLADFSPNDYGEATVDEGESKLTVRNRLRAAAGRRGLKMTFLRTSGPMVRFKVEEDDGAQTMGDLAEPAAKPKRGRQKKQQPAE